MEQCERCKVYDSKLKFCVSCKKNVCTKECLALDYCQNLDGECFDCFELFCENNRCFEKITVEDVKRRGVSSFPLVYNGNSHKEFFFCIKCVENKIHFGDYQCHRCEKDKDCEDLKFCRNCNRWVCTKNCLALGYCQDENGECFDCFKLFCDECFEEITIEDLKRRGIPEFPLVVEGDTPELFYCEKCLEENKDLIGDKD